MVEIVRINHMSLYRISKDNVVLGSPIWTADCSFPTERSLRHEMIFS